MIWRLTALDSFASSTTGGRRGLLEELGVVFTVRAGADGAS